MIFARYASFKSKYEWKYLHMASRMYGQGRFYAKVFSGCSCLQSKLTVEWGGTFESIKCPLQTRCTKRRSIRSFAALLNLTNNSGCSSLFQFRFVHMDGYSSTSTSSPWVKNQGIGRTSDKRKISGSWKIEPQPTAATAAAATPAVSLSVRLLCFPSCDYFRNPDALDPSRCLRLDVR